MSAAPSGSWQAAAESGKLGHGDGGHGRGDRRRRAFMSTNLRNGERREESATGRGELSASICKRLRIGALDRGIDWHGLELFTFDSTTGEGAQ